MCIKNVDFKGLYIANFIKNIGPLKRAGPPEDKAGFLDFVFPNNDEDDIYKNFSSLWVSKIDENKFIFKLSVPNLLFTYFTLEFV